jgi:hypothetical protein
MQAAEVGSSNWQRLTTETPVRSAVRFPVQLAIRLQTESGAEVDATTEDVSANGLLFRGEELPGVDSKIEFTMRMPGPVMGSAQDVLIHCVGRVVRHQRHSDGDIAAAVIDEYFLKA